MSLLNASSAIRCVSVAVLAAALSPVGFVSAQQLPRSFEASSETDKVLAQNDQYRVVAVICKPGQHDVLHSRPATAVCYLTNCVSRIHSLDGEFFDAKPFAGAAIVQPLIPGRVLENIAASECNLIMLEPAQTFDAGHCQVLRAAT
jgi:hypothetical protein